MNTTHVTITSCPPRIGPDGNADVGGIQWTSRFESQTFTYIG